MFRFLVFLLFSCFLGCSAFSPRMKRQDVSDSKINGLENNQNAIKAELGRISNDLQLQNSNIKEMQQGWANLQTTVSKNENSGIQILQGDGPLIATFGVVTMGMLFFYLFQAEKYRKATRILAQEIVRCPDPSLKRRVVAAAENTDVEKLILEITGQLPPTH